MRSLDAAAVTAALPFATLIPALRDAFLADVTAPQRHRHPLHGNATLLLMPAWGPAHLGVKIVTVHPDNAMSGMDAVHSSYLLSNAGTGEPIALLDGDTLTARRTAAASALAASFLSPPGASRLLIVGAGRVAALMPAAYATVRPIADVMVWNRGQARRDALVDALRRDGVAARAVDDLAAAVATADIVSCATVSTSPLIRGDWLRPGIHLDLVGAFRPEMREADAAAVSRAFVYADTEAALTECGELSGMAPGDLAGTLRTLCGGQPPAGGAGAITLFKSVGTAIEDLAAAVLAVRISS